MKERRSRVLQLVAEAYIETAHPVPSGHVAERLDVSSATVRNDFSSLENEGLLQQPHASAGRIPTPLGFRVYASRFLPPRPLPTRLRRQLDRQLDAAAGDQLYALASRLAAQLSGYAVTIRLPPDDALQILEIHLSTLSSRRLLAVVVLENGLVRQLGVDLDPVPGSGVIDDAERNLRQLTVPVGDVPRALSTLAAHAGEELARTLWNLHVAAVGTDTPGFEAWPLGPDLTPDQRETYRTEQRRLHEIFAHTILLPMLGLPLGELFALDALAADCAADGRYEFMLTSAPLNLPNGVASPPNALAIK